MATNFVDTSDFTGRALLVEGISSVHSQCQNADKITIHFQKKGNKGGDVTKVLYPLDSNRDAAIVVFEDAMDRESALLHRHVFYEVSLKVERLPPVFRAVEVEIDPVYATLLPDMVQCLMNSYGTSRNPSLGRQKTHKLSFSCPNELRYVEEDLYNKIARQSETPPFSSTATGHSYPEQMELTEQEVINYEDEVVNGKEGSRYQPEEFEPEFFIDQRTTERDDSADHAADDKKIEGNETSTTDVQVRGLSEQSSDYGDGSTFQQDNSVVLDMFSYNFLVKYEKDAVKKILKKHNVRITENNMDLSVRATFAACKSKTSKEEIQKAVEEFTSLYQTTHSRLYRKAVECPPSISTDVLEKAASETSKVFGSNALITQVDHNPIYYVILSSNDAEEVAQHFRKRAGIQSKKKLRTANPASGPENKETVPEQTTSRSAATNLSMSSDGSYGQNETNSLSGSSADNSVVLDLFSYNFLVKYENDAVKKILKKHNVQITENKIDLSVRVTFAACKSKTSKEEIQKAVEDFTSLYQSTHNRIYRKSVECPPSISTDVLEKAASETSKVFESNALITQVDRNPIYYVILSSNDAEEVAQHFRKGAGIQSKKKLRSANPAPGTENKETVPEQTTDRFAATNQSTTFYGSYGQNKTESLGGSSELHSSQTPGDIFVTNEGMTICIRKGDITKQHEVHAIINPTDSNLRSSGGASKAIETAAGPQLRKWCDQYMHNRWGRTLQSSECCVSPGFNLSCHSIIHIAPMNVPYNKQQWMNVLYQTFTNCLQAAHACKVKSLAMPLLGSGATGAPKKACADALVQVLIDFSCAPSRFLTEVYLVNIDSEANRALKHSFESAFKETKRTKSGDQRSSTASVNNGRSAEMSLLGKSTNATKDRTTHISGPMPTESNLPLTHANADQGYKSTTDEKGQSDMKTNFGAGPIAEKKPVDSTNATSKECPICLLDMLDVKILKCGHRFCRKCIDKSFEQSHLCPICRAVCAQPKGNQPEGTMSSTTNPYTHLPGYGDVGTIFIYYNIRSGTQSECHPHPGKYFSGVTRTAYLPDNRAGRKVLSLLKKAFDAGLVFTVGRSITSGLDDTITWNDIHHKTSQTGGPSKYGYPDPGYLKRVTEDLAALGIV